VGETQDLEYPVRSHGLAQESGLCCASAFERHRKRLVLLAHRAGWFVALVYFHQIAEADGTAELSLTVPITNSLAFLFTVLGEWWAEGKVISRGT